MSGGAVRPDARVVAITGGGSGLGRALVDRFVTEGAQVVVLEISPERAAALEADFPDAVVCVRGDATVLSDNRKLVQTALDRCGRLDTFIANTGYWDFGISLEDLPHDQRLDEAFDQLFSLNVKALLLGAKAAAPALRESRGSIIMTGSPASFHPGGGGPLYTAAKHAVRGLVKQLAYELAPEVRVNGVAPGGMRTAMVPPPSLRDFAGTMADLPMEEIIAVVSPLEHLPAPADYAGWYVMLASSRDALTITGEMIECDGGEAVRGRAFSAHARAIAGDPRATGH